jgi:serine/threonine protein kinase
VIEEAADETLKKICPTCGKRMAGGNRSGSLTGFLFGAADCTCLLGGRAQQDKTVTSKAGAEGEIDFCPKCGLQVVHNSRDGSLTGFLFQSTRCKCPPDRAFADGDMAARFWQLKQAGQGTTFTSAASQSDRAATHSIDLAAGAIIGGAYEIIALIGQGGMGEVYLARHETLGKKCALKVIPPEQVTAIGWQRFQLEAKAVAKLDHINLVRVTDLGIHEGCLPFYAMDYVEGRNLAELLVEQGPMPLKAALEIFTQVCDGVECAHRSGILHRDLKPANIMLIANKTGLKQAKVLDFGLAKLTKHDRSKQSLTAVGDVFGSPFYMSPEQCNGERLDNRSDIYSLGCTIFECLTGRPPFTGHLASAVIFSHMQADPPELASALSGGKFPAAMEIVVAKLLRKNPAERYQTLSQLKADLELVADGREVLPIYVARDQRVLARAEDPGAEAPQRVGGRLNGPTVALIGATCIFAVLGPAWLSIYRQAGKAELKNPVSVTAVEHAKSAFASSRNSDKQSLALADTPMIDESIDLDDLMNFNITSFRDTAFRVHHLVAAYKADPQTAGTPFVKNGHPRGFQFPNDFIIGYIKIGDKAPENASGFIPAAPAIAVCMYFSYFTADWPDILDKFGPDDLTGLEVVAEHPPMVIEKVSHWHRLSELSFFNSLTQALAGTETQYDESFLKNEDLLLIDKLSALKSLGLCGPRIDGSAVLAMHLLSTINTLKLKRISNLKPLLDDLQSRDNITELWLVGQATQDQDLEPLKRMKKLETLRIRRSKLTPASIQYFKEMPALKHLFLDCQWTPAEVDKFKKELPFFQLESATDSRYWQMFPYQEGIPGVTDRLSPLPGVHSDLPSKTFQRKGHEGTKSY